MNISRTLTEDLSGVNCTYTIFDQYMNSEKEQGFHKEGPHDITIYNQTDGFLQMNSYRIPKKKEVNLEWVMNKVNSKSAFINFTENFKTLLKEEGILNALSCYPTSYGIGVSVVFSFRGSARKLSKQIEELLNKKKIQFRTETSEAGWVFRFIISKNKENIARL